ncbi:helix-turn-helix domain-containing protein [Chitinophaga arvensicola]|uniref:AraC-type DNA-binding protein n=1 Tax=Chitinophaga arvensicola TaxID=29529 RepID=A0A1I0RTW9_9BACT|nr:AraC family transcriptional regulator [Chitinophaga arvensicola]SEW44854.1 AraC-type DNA-binding protein [Chitinophaga arvensicola]
MIDNTLPADLRGVRDPADQLSIFCYDSAVASVKAKITLPQNLFSFLLEGEKTVHYAGTQVKINPQQFLLLSAGNCLMSEKIAAEGGRYRSILIFFDNVLLADFFNRHPQVLATTPGRIPETPFLLFEKDPFLFNFIASLGFMLASGQPISTHMGRIKLEELLLYLSEHYPGEIQKLQSVCQQVEADMLIRQAVTANMDNNITVEEFAFLCNTSLSTFKRRFAKIYGTSPYKWLLEKRMQKAAQMLTRGEYKASEIYYELGYENLSSFIQSFKQVHGITPRQYQSGKLNV